MLPKRGEPGPAPKTITRQELAHRLGWDVRQVDAATALSLARGDVMEGPGGHLVLTARGRFHRDALTASRNEGEDHCGLLADAAGYLSGRGLPVGIVEQGGDYLLPDAEFEWRGGTYSVEVECSTLASHRGQAVRNVRKALALKRRVLVVVENREDAETFARVLRKEVPEVEIWNEVGLMRRDRARSIVPCEIGGRKPWSFLPGGVEGEIKDSFATPNKPEVPWVAPEDPHSLDLALVRHWAKRLLATGKWEVTADAFRGAFGESAETPVDRVRLGMALETLGVKKSRARREGKEKATYYDLRTMSGASGPQSGDSKLAPEAVREPSDNPQEKGREPDSKTDPSGHDGQGRADGQTYEEEQDRGSAQGGLPDDSD